MVDGQAWNWFCGPSCATKSARFHGLARYQHTYRQRTLRRLVALVKPQVDVDGKVDAKMFVRAFMRELTKAYNRGYNRAMWYRTQEHYPEATSAESPQAF